MCCDPKIERKKFSDFSSLHDIVTYLGNDSFQEGVILPCLSIVFDMLTGKIYKMPLDYAAHDRLTSLLWRKQTGGFEPEQVLLLEGKEKHFFIFPRLKPSLDIKSLQSCFDSFAVSVLHAVKEIYRLGYVHLDLRIPNICFSNKNGRWQAVLIDLGN